MKDESIKIQPVSENSEARVRRQFRVPVLVEDEAVLVSGDTRYPVVEISLEGISVRIREGMSFNEDEELDGCRLILGNMKFSGLNGKVVHCSFDAEGFWRCGIKWVEMSDREKEQMEGILGQMKDMALKKNDRDTGAK
ncbi:PilZ domain-containing protein [Desulfospira joergensenii]|uniref:PilZ domain-containing protein n=1 Tax=Desulfospira joergensenii TaxID=53329 RepID=UPI0003B72E17|nr:PilZ domain-containing protein [Desulfospira joergensenii]